MREFAEITGDHLEQQKLERKEEGNIVYGADGMEHDDADVGKNGCMAFLNNKAADIETYANVDFAGKIDEVSVMGSFSSLKKYGSSDSALVEEDDILVDSSKNCSEQSLVFSGTKPYLVANMHCQRASLSQSDQTLLYQVDEAFTSSDSSSEVALTAIVNNCLSSDVLSDGRERLAENFDTILKESIIHEEFKNHNDLKGTRMRPHYTYLKRRKSNLADFTEYGLGKKVCQESSLSDNLMGAIRRSSTPVDVVGGYLDCNKMVRETNFSSNKLNSCVTDLTGGILSVQNNINEETTLQSYLNEGPSIKADAAEKDTVDRTLDYPLCSAEGFRQHKIDFMPLLNEHGNDEHPEKTFRRMIKTTVSDKINCTMHEEKPFECSFSPVISIEFNQKVLYANFKGELSLPPSPITGVMDCFVGKPNRDSNHLDSNNEEESTFSFHAPNKSFSIEIPKNDIGFEMPGVVKRAVESFDCSQNQTENPLEFVSIGIHGDRVTQQKDRIASFSFSSTLEDDSLSKENKEEEVQEIGSMPSRRLLTCPTRRKLLVLDLNGLLCDIVNDYCNSYGVEKKVGGKPFFKRPFCDDFLKFCFDHFHIGIWSSRRKYNVDSALDNLMEEFKHKLLFCWDQSKCTYTGARTIENRHKPLVLKELKKLWNKEESDLPWEKGDFSQSNTLLLDDSPYKALCNPPYTAIFPYPYKYTDERDNALGPGGDIRAYLENLFNSGDVQRFVEEHPFGQPAITDSDQHWHFYCQIIKSNTTQSS